MQNQWMDAFQEKTEWNLISCQLQVNSTFSLNVSMSKMSSKVLSPSQMHANSFRHSSRTKRKKKKNKYFLSCFAKKNVTQWKKRNGAGDVWVSVRFEFWLIFCCTFCRILWLQIVCWPEHDSSAQWVQADGSLISLISRDHVLCECTVGIVLSSRDPKPCLKPSVTWNP